MTVAALPILAPLAAAILTLALRRWPAAVALMGAAVTLVAALVTVGRVWDGDQFAAELPGLPGLPLRLTVDPASSLFATMVAVVGAAVLVFAVGYMAGDRDRVRFFAGMSLFVAAMQTLVVAGDWILLLAAWELIGAASWLLIGFWFERDEVGAAATRAFLVTRAADVGLYVAAFALIVQTGTNEIAAAGPLAGGTATVAGIGFLVAVVGKSAQVPLQGWLMDAMVGPTPVSALLHAATLVAAGVVLLVRALPLLPPGVLLAVGLVGGVSSVLTGLIAFAQTDLKRLLAASTSSQLGLMLLALGAGSVPAAVFHLVTHAAMKSALFLGAGIFQHDRESTSFADLAGIGRRLRAAFAAMTVAGLALAGVPPLAGFWSKDGVIAATLAAPQPWLLVPLAAVASGLTGLYIGRTLRVLWQPSVASDPATGRSVAGQRWMLTGLVFLAALAATLGLAATPIGHLLDATVPEGTAATVIGLVAVAVGLAVGWLLSLSRLPGGIVHKLMTGLRLDGGLAGLVGRPALAVASACDQIDRALHGTVLAVGRQAQAFAVADSRLDDRLHGAVIKLGRASLRTASGSRLVDECGIDGLIAGLVDRTRQLGGQARRLQSGLVHRELLLAGAGVAVVLIIIAVARAS